MIQRQSILKKPSKIVEVDEKSGMFYDKSAAEALRVIQEKKERDLRIRIWKTVICGMCLSVLACISISTMLFANLTKELNFITQLQNNNHKDLVGYFSDLKSRVHNASNSASRRSIRSLNLGNDNSTSGWFDALNGYRYMFIMAKQSATKAAKMCEKRGGWLASYGMQDIRMRRVLSSLSNSSDSEKIHFWIGLRYIKDKKEWVWSNSGAVGPRFTSYWDSAVENSDGRKKCACMNSASSSFFPKKCNEKLMSLCEATAK